MESHANSFSNLVDRMRLLHNSWTKLSWAVSGAADTLESDSDGARSLRFSRLNESECCVETTIDVDSLIVVTCSLNLASDTAFTIVQNGTPGIIEKAKHLRIHSEQFPPLDSCTIIHFGGLAVGNHDQIVFLIIRREEDGIDQVRAQVYDQVIYRSVKAVGNTALLSRIAPNYTSAKIRSQNAQGQYDTLTTVAGSGDARLFIEHATSALDAMFPGQWSFLVDCIGFKSLVAKRLPVQTLPELRTNLTERGGYFFQTIMLMDDLRKYTGFSRMWCVNFDSRRDLIYADYGVTIIPAMNQQGAGQTLLWGENVMTSPFIKWLRDTPAGYGARTIHIDRFANMPEVAGFRVRMDRTASSVVSATSAGGAEDALYYMRPRNLAYVQAYQTMRYRSQTNAVKSLKWIGDHRRVQWSHASELCHMTQRLAQAICDQTRHDAADHGVRIEFRVNLCALTFSSRNACESQQEVEQNWWDIVSEWVSQLLRPEYILACPSRDLNDYLAITAECLAVLSKRTLLQLARMNDFTAEGDYIHEYNFARRPLHALLVAAFSLQRGLLHREPTDETWYKNLCIQTCKFTASAAGDASRWHRFINFKLEDVETADPDEEHAWLPRLLWSPAPEDRPHLEILLSFGTESSHGQLGRQALFPPEYQKTSRVTANKVREAYFGAHGRATGDFVNDPRTCDLNELLVDLAVECPDLWQFWRMFVTMVFLGMQSLPFIPRQMTADTFCMDEHHWKTLMAENHVFVIVKEAHLPTQRFCETKIFQQRASWHGDGRVWSWGPLMHKLFELPLYHTQDKCHGATLRVKFKSFCYRVRRAYPNDSVFFVALVRSLQEQGSAFLSCVPDFNNQASKRTTLLAFEHKEVSGRVRVQISVQFLKRIELGQSVAADNLDAEDLLMEQLFQDKQTWTRWGCVPMGKKNAYNSFEHWILQWMLGRMSADRRPTQAQFAKDLIQKAKDFATRANTEYADDPDVQQVFVHGFTEKNVSKRITAHKRRLLALNVTAGNL